MQTSGSKRSNSMQIFATTVHVSRPPFDLRIAFLDLHAASFCSRAPGKTRPAEGVPSRSGADLRSAGIGSKQKGPAEEVAPRVSSLKICRFRVCVFPLIPWRKYDSQRPLLGGDFLGQTLAADSLPGAFVHSRRKHPSRQAIFFGQNLPHSGPSA